MSEYPQPGLHPEPDSLNALIEGMLPEHERLACLAHLAECARCREVVYLAQEPTAAEPLPVPAEDTIPFWKRWLRPIPALTAAAVAGVLVLSVALYRNDKPAATAPELVARARPQQEPALPPSMSKERLADSPASPKISPETPLRAVPPAASRIVQRATPETLQQKTERKATVADTDTLSGAAPAAAAPGIPLVRETPSLPRQSAPLQSGAAGASAGTAGAELPSGIAGTITDVSGGVISGAAVSVRQVVRNASRNVDSDARGQFNVAGLEPGRYELQVAAPGFQQIRTQVELQAGQTARADLTLQIGSVSETVSVEAAPLSVNTSTSTVAGNAKKSAARPRPADGTTVTRGKLMLGTDSGGALLRSDNAGKTWKTVKPVWQGKVAGLAAIAGPASSSGAAFQLTTDTGAVWLSRDGNRWYAAPAQR